MISLETDDDKEEFNISAGKNLSRLFDDDQPGSTEQSKSALFYRPKQNRKPTTESSEKSRSGSLPSSSPAPAHKLQAYAASAVDVYKLDQGKYVYVGKLGIALMGPSSSASTLESGGITFRLILYTAKNQPIAGATITEKFKFVCQADNYCSFYDDAQQNWSIRFGAAADVTRFAVQIAHAHFGVLLSSKKNTSSDLRVVQSLTPVSTNSSLSLPSEHRLLTDFVVTFELTVRGFAQGEHSLTAKEPLIEKKVTELRITTESSPPLLKLLFTPSSSSDTKCLEQSKVVICCPEEATSVLTGQQLNLTDFWKVELLITVNSVVPFEQWSSASSSSPANKKTNKKSSKSKDLATAAAAEAEITSEEAEIPNDSLTPVPAKRRSNSNTSSSSSFSAAAAAAAASTADSLATRMARMGAQPLFPLLTATPSKEIITTESKAEPKTESTTENSSINSSKPTELPMTSSSSKTEPTNIPPKPEKALQTFQPQHSKAPADHLKEQLLSIQSSIKDLKILLLTSQNQQQQPPPPLQLTSSLSMDSTLLLNSIQKLITDNESLKAQLAEKSKDLDALNGKFIELFGQQKSSNTITTFAETPTDPKTLENTTFALRTDLLAAREEIASLKGEKYSLSIENLRLEKAVLEGEKTVAELTSRLSSASRAFKGSLKQTLNSVYSEFSEKLLAEKRTDSKATDDDFVLRLLSEVLLGVKRTTEGKVREEWVMGKYENDSAVFSLSKKSSTEVAVKKENEDVNS